MATTTKLASRKIDDEQYEHPGLTPDEVLLQPDDYELPDYIPATYRNHQEKMKQTIKVTRKQIQYFGERGAPWREIERFYGVGRTTLQRYYLQDYEKGFASTNIALRNKQTELALNGNPTMLIWVGKNRLGQADTGEVMEAETVSGSTDPREVIVVRPTKDDM